MSEMEKISLATVLRWIGVLIAFSLFKVLGISLFIPTVFFLLSFAALRYTDKKLKAKGGAFGGLGTAYQENVPYKGLLSLELGQLLWFVLGIGTLLAGVPIGTELEFDSSKLIVISVFFTLVIFFLVKPNWLSVILLVAYHCYDFFDIYKSFDSLSYFSFATRKIAEQLYITKGLLDLLALSGLVWFSYALFVSDRTPSAWLKSFFSKQHTESINSKNDIHERIAKLQGLRNSGLISEYDYETKKNEILRDL